MANACALARHRRRESGVVGPYSGHTVPYTPYVIEARVCKPVGRRKKSGWLGRRKKGRTKAEGGMRRVHFASPLPAVPFRPLWALVRQNKGLHPGGAFEKALRLGACAPHSLALAPISALGPLISSFLHQTTLIHVCESAATLANISHIDERAV
jgi:hypothetical protein